MSPKRKKQRRPRMGKRKSNGPPEVHRGIKTKKKYGIDDAVRLVLVNGLTQSEALIICGGSVSKTTLNSRLMNHKKAKVAELVKQAKRAACPPVQVDLTTPESRVSEGTPASLVDALPVVRPGHWFDGLVMREATEECRLDDEMPGQSDPNKRLEDLQQSYDKYAAKIEAAGFNPVFNKQIPRAAQIKRKETTEEQINEIVDKKGAFSAGGIWQNMGSMLCNGDAIIAAQRQQIAEAEEKQQAVSQRKEDASKERGDKAQAAFAKHQRKEKLGAKDWKDIIMFVLPAAGETDPPTKFTRVDAIKERLGKLEKGWEHYLSLEG